MYRLLIVDDKEQDHARMVDMVTDLETVSAQLGVPVTVDYIRVYERFAEMYTYYVAIGTAYRAVHRDHDTIIGLALDCYNARNPEEGFYGGLMLAQMLVLGTNVHHEETHFEAAMEHVFGNPQDRPDLPAETICSEMQDVLSSVPLIFYTLTHISDKFREYLVQFPKALVESSLVASPTRATNIMNFIIEQWASQGNHLRRLR